MFLFFYSIKMMEFFFLGRKEEKMDNIEKWLLYLDGNKVVVERKQLNKYIPINRMLDVAGVYNLDVKHVRDRTYLIVFEQLEVGIKSKILVSRTYKNDNGGGITNLDDSDFEYIEEIAEHYLK